MFANLLLADEINRAPAKVQSALLEVMQERQVTIGGETFKVPEPFLVMATQNPIETDGTYPLPGGAGGPLHDEGARRLPQRGGGVRHRPADDRATCRGEPGGEHGADPRAPAQPARRVFVDPLLMQHAVRLAAATRNPERYGIAGHRPVHRLRRQPPRLHQPHHRRPRPGVRPRAARYVIPQDVTDLAHDVMRHRIIPSYEALSDGVTTDAILAEGDGGDSRPRAAPAGHAAASVSDPERILQRLDWTVIRRLDGLLQGNYRTLFRGFGLELAELREYQLTDDVRAIDWNVTARMQTPYVRQFVEDREVTAWFLLDLSPSVDFGTAATEKRPAGGFRRRVSPACSPGTATGSARSSSTGTRSA